MTISTWLMGLTRLTGLTVNSDYRVDRDSKDYRVGNGDRVYRVYRVYRVGRAYRD